MFCSLKTENWCPFSVLKPQGKNDHILIFGRKIKKAGSADIVKTLSSFITMWISYGSLKVLNHTHLRTILFTAHVHSTFPWDRFYPFLSPSLQSIAIVKSREYACCHLG